MAVSRINGVAALRRFIIRKCMAILPGQKKVAVIRKCRINEMAVRRVPLYTNKTNTATKQ